jgi:hypothetical protein
MGLSYKPCNIFIAYFTFPCTIGFVAGHKGRVFNNKIVSIMKAKYYLLFFIPLLLFFSSCDYNYPEEVTYSGKNIHGFKLNGEEWVKLKTFLPSSGCTYASDIEIISCGFSSIREDSSHYPQGVFNLMLYADQNSFVAPVYYSFSELNDSILLNYETSNYLDPTTCYCQFIYEKKQYEETTYSKVVSGELQLLRFDTLLVGTFQIQLSDGTDTITLTDGKFDYQLEIE